MKKFNYVNYKKTKVIQTRAHRCMQCEGNKNESWMKKSTKKKQ